MKEGCERKVSIVSRHTNISLLMNEGNNLQFSLEFNSLESIGLGTHRFLHHFLQLPTLVWFCFRIHQTCKNFITLKLNIGFWESTFKVSNQNNTKYILFMTRCEQTIYPSTYCGPITIECYLLTIWRMSTFMSKKSFGPIIFLMSTFGPKKKKPPFQFSCNVKKFVQF